MNADITRMTPDRDDEARIDMRPIIAKIRKEQAETFAENAK